MAWYAELKRRKWYCINGVDMIHAYKKKLYDDWYNSLTDEQKQRLEEYRKAKADKRKREAEMALARLGMMFDTKDMEECMITWKLQGSLIESACIRQSIGNGQEWHKWV